MGQSRSMSADSMPVMAPTTKLTKTEVERRRAAG